MADRVRQLQRPGEEIFWKDAGDWLVSLAAGTAGVSPPFFRGPLTVSVVQSFWKKVKGSAQIFTL